MASEPPLSRLLRRAPQLIGLSRAADIVAWTCHEARAIAGVRLVIGAYALAPQPWEASHHVVVGDVVRPLEGPARSATYAIHRRLGVRREAMRLTPCEENATILKGLSHATSDVDAPVDEAHAIPLVHGRTGRVIGELVLVGRREEEGDDVPAALANLAALTAATLEGAQRLRAARQDQDRLLLVAETTDEAIWDWNVDTGELWWGGGIQKILGSGTEPVKARAEWKESRIHPEDVSRVRETLAACFASTRSSWAEHYRFRRTDGTWAQVEDRGHVLREPSGRGYRMIGALRDVSALHESHEALRHKEERLRAALAASDVASRAKDEFLAMLGHELRNPLSPMLVALRILRMRGASSREIDVLERQVGHLTRLVDDLLDVSRITRGKIELRREPLDVARLVGRAVEIVSPLMEERGHVLTVNVPPGLVVDGDEARLAQVLSNLLTNAAKYSDPGSTIAVVADKVAGRARIRVVDNGVGIAPEMLERVFDLFVQQPQTLDRAQGGLGLGLAIVKNLVEMHGGTVVVRSDGPGLGSTFTVELPLWDTAQATPGLARDASADSMPDRRGERILVVDDNPDGAGMLKEALELLGHRVEVAHDGPTALAIADRFGPGIALLDIGLPIMDGYELARHLRRRGPDLRLVAITGYGQEQDRQRSAEAGFHMHLVKPIDLDKLAAAIGQSPAAEE